MRAHDRLLGEMAAELRTRPEHAPEALRALAQARKELERAARKGPAGAAADIDELVAGAEELAGVRVLVARTEAPDAKALLELLDRVKGRLGDGRDRARRAVGRSRAPRRERRPEARGARPQGGRAREGRGRAGGRRGRRARHDRPGRRDGTRRSWTQRPAGRAARRSTGALRRRLGPGAAGAMRGALALDYGSARCGCAISDPTGTIVTPIGPCRSPAAGVGWRS